MNILLITFLLILLLLAAIWVFLICPRLSRRLDMNSYHGQSFAHRGYHAIQKGIPENSMPAFARALAHGFGIELDVHLSADGQVVVFHDDTLQRICGNSATIESKTYAELLTYPLLHTDERMPLLKDVLDLVDGKVPLLIELKLPIRDEQLCPCTYDLLKDYQGPYLIQSFNTMAIRWFKLHANHVLRGQLSCNLTSEKNGAPYLFRFLIRFLLSNFLGRPDFISYRYGNRHNCSLWVLHHLFGCPVALWTLKQQTQYQICAAHFEMMIFEEFPQKQL